MTSAFWSAHTHSKHSAADALPSVADVVRTASNLGYPALGLTDHGNMGGVAQLYTECRKVDVSPLPGVEAYIHLRRPTKGSKGGPKSFHMGMLATSAVGYRNLVGLSNLAHRNFYHKPVLDLADLAEAGADGRLEGVAAMSGCWFGILPTLLREGDPQAVRNLLTGLDSWFGSGLYVELQHHNIPDQDDAGHVDLLHRIASSLGLPSIITQDSHYCHLADREQHETMKSLYSWSDDPESALFPGDGYHMANVDWMKTRYTATQLSDGLAGLADLCAKSAVSIPELDSFHLSVPDTGSNPDRRLREAVETGLEEKLALQKINKRQLSAYKARVEEEMDVVTGAGFSGYLLLTATVCDFMRDKDILFTTRGSASGSLLCWLLGITSLDPLKWDLPFDRFLSRDRTKPPDIDLDIEHRRRDEVIEWIGQRHHTVRIGRWVEMKMRADEGEEKGALIVKWKMMRRKLGLDDSAPDEKELDRLRSLARFAPYGAYGSHPAGLMITPDEATAGCVPLMWSASGKTMVTAFEMGDIERLGLVKLDLLSGKTMTALKFAFDRLGLTMDDIPFNDTKTFTLIRSKPTTGLFQLEGRAQSAGMRQLKPRRFEDLVAAMALFRPQGMQSGITARYLARRNGEEATPKYHPIIAEATKDTYGVVLYQEQILHIIKKLGLQVEDMERVRKAVKASNDNVEAARQAIEEVQSKIASLADEAGMDADDKAWLRESLMASAEYGFNKAHSVSYAALAYITAYVRCNHPAEFWAGMLTAYADSTATVWYGRGPSRREMTQADSYRLAAIDDGVEILPPHVNKSLQGWSVDDSLGAIRSGLTSIHGIRAAADEIVAHQPYMTLDDLAFRVTPGVVTGARKLGEGHTPGACGGVIAALHEAGALVGLERDPAQDALRAETAANKAAKAQAAFDRRLSKELLELAKSEVADYELDRLASGGEQLKRLARGVLVRALHAWLLEGGYFIESEPDEQRTAERIFIENWVEENM